MATLKEDFVEDDDSTTIVAAFANGQIQALIGLDIDEDSAEVWGPFSLNENTVLQKEMLLTLQQHYPGITTYYFFINEMNTRQLAFMQKMNITKSGEHLLLKVSKDEFEPVQTRLSRSYEITDYQQFKQLHSTAFPKTYYDADTILKRVQHSTENRLIILEQMDTVQGYAYFEVDLIAAEAHLEYIAIHPDFRGKGIGTLLLKEVLTEMFSFDRISEITLTVNNKNDRANYVYFKAGFVKKACLWSFNLNV